MLARTIQYFSENKKYHRWYFAIVDRARDRKLDDYTERHHVIPRSFGGSDEKHNLVDLTFREHFVCHWLLTRMTEGEARRSMLRALNYMCNGNGVWKKKGVNYRRGRGVIPSWQYDVARRAVRNAQIGSKRPGIHSEESCARIGASLKGNKNKLGKKQFASEEARVKASINIKASWTDKKRELYAERWEVNNPMSHPAVVKKVKASWTEERRSQLGKSDRFIKFRTKGSEALKGRKRPDTTARFKGKPRQMTDEHRAKIRTRMIELNKSPEHRAKVAATRALKQLSLPQT